MRLLRIVNGKSCENRNCERKTNSTRLGLYICATCASELTTHRQSWRETRCQDYETIITDDRVDKTWVTMLLKEPFQGRGEEPIGPLVTYRDMEVMMNTGTSLDRFFEQPRAAREIPLNDNQEISQRLWQVFDRAAADKKEIWSQWNNRREGKEKAKVDKVIDAIGKVKSMLLNKHIKDYAMEYTVSKDGTHCSLNYGITHELMKEIVHAPSKITNKKVQQIAASIDAAYPLVVAHGMHDFSCLSWQDPLQHAIRAYLIDQPTVFEPGLPFLRDPSFSGAIASLKKHKDAISPVLKRVFSWTYFGMVPVELRNIIAELIVDQQAGGATPRDLKLAQSICAGINQSAVTKNTHFPSSSTELSTSAWTLCQRLYGIALYEYTLLRPAVTAYLCDDWTRTFLSNRQDCTTTSLSDLWMEAKQAVVGKILYSASDYDTVKSVLLQCDWAALREYHSTKVWPEFKEMSSTMEMGNYYQRR